MNSATLSLLFVLSFAAQSGKAEVVSLGREFDLKVRQEAMVEGQKLAVSFDSVLEDSRCPEGADCIWSGNAKIRLKLNKTGHEPATMELHTDLEPKNSSYLNYEIRLIALKPRPKLNETIQPDGYKATLVVLKK